MREYLYLGMSGKTDKEREIRVRGVSEKTQTELMNIAGNSGVNLSNFLRPKLTELVNSYPEHMRQSPKKD